jgi:hypothetical protein
MSVVAVLRPARRLRGLVPRVLASAAHSVDVHVQPCLLRLESLLDGEVVVLSAQPQALELSLVGGRRLKCSRVWGGCVACVAQMTEVADGDWADMRQTAADMKMVPVWAGNGISISTVCPRDAVLNADAKESGCVVLSGVTNRVLACNVLRLLGAREVSCLIVEHVGCSRAWYLLHLLWL